MVAEALEYGERASKSVLQPTRAPAGFAVWRKQGRWQAVSPDGVSLRIRSAKIPSKNRASVDFWSEALETRMLEAGYTLDAEQTLTTDGGHEVHVLELSGANGPVDQAFVVAITLALLSSLLILPALYSPFLKRNAANALGESE